MFPLKKIVCPTDFSKPSLDGLRNGIEMADKFDALIYIVHVIELPNWSSHTYPPATYSAPDVSAQLNEEAIKNLNKLQTEMVPERVAYRLLTLEGKPADQIVKFAQEEAANLIVIATHGYSGLHRFVFGSVTERVVRTSACPVLTVRSKAS